MTARPAAPTIRDVAALAGVSKSVVSRALGGEYGVAATTRARVEHAAEQLGYVPNAHARGMSARRSHTLGVFVRDASTPFYGHLLTAFQLRAAARGYRTVTATGAGSFAVADERRALEHLVGLRVEGLIVCSGALPIDDVLPLARRVPTVVAGRPEDAAGVSSVFCDEHGGGTALAEHVAGLGHVRVAVLSVAPASSLTLSARTAAMLARLRELGVDAVELRVEDHGDDPARVGELLDLVLAAGGVTAVMTPSDLWGIALLEALRDRGLRAPDDLSVTGYDGVLPFATGLVGLTTWRQPLDAIGALSVDDVVDQIDGASPGARHRSLDGSLLPGRTAASPR